MQKNKRWFRKFFPYRWGMPTHYTIRKICMLIDPEEFEQLFVDWMHDVIQEKKGELTDDVIAVDGKALRGSRPAKGKKMVHIVSTYSTQLNLILGFTAVDKKSNEITAIPKVLDMLAIEGALITSDAMGCQKAICQKILDKKADYLISVKDNQPTLAANIETVFNEYIADVPVDPEPSGDNPFFAETEEISRNRHEHRRCWVSSDIALIDPDNEWPGLTQFAIIQRDRLVNNIQSTEIHFHIMSREMTAGSVLANVRSHWGIENKQHWKLDVSFKEDDSRIHERTATRNVATVRRICFNAHEQSNRYADESMEERIFSASLDPKYRAELVREYAYR